MTKNLLWMALSLGCVAAIAVWVRPGCNCMMRTPARAAQAPRAAAKSASSYSLPHFGSLNVDRMQRNGTTATTACGWGKLVVYLDKQPRNFKDVKIWVGNKDAQAKEWDWNITQTRHVPGIQPADLDEFIDQVDEVILTRGVESVLQVPQETIDYVKSKGKICHMGETPEMIELYNKLVDQGKKVGGVFHSTC